jgi:hypothetical protein
MSDYHDPRIECTDDALLIHGYYFPWGTKRIPYTSIRSLDRFTLSLRNGKGRIWGSGDFKHWANFDAGRPKKDVGFRLDVGGRVIPWVTPDDPDAFEQAVRRHLPPGTAA